MNNHEKNKMELINMNIYHKMSTVLSPVKSIIM